MFAYRVDAEPGGVGLAFTDRYDGHTQGTRGPLNLGRSDEDPAVAANMSDVLSALGLDRVVALAQWHTATVYRPNAKELATLGPQSFLGSAVGSALPRADAVVLSRTEIQRCRQLLGRHVQIGAAIRVADCLPVILHDDGNWLGVVHAGRQGLVDGVLPATVAALRTHGAGPLQAIIGPHICGACYEVPAELRDQVTQVLPGASAETSWGTPALDLGWAAMEQLLDLDVTTVDLGLCTRTDPGLHSYRRDGADSGRLAAFAWFG